MLTVLLFALSLPAPQCLTQDFDPGMISADLAFHTGLRGAMEDIWDPSWGKAIATLTYSDSTGLRVRTFLQSGDSAQAARVSDVLDESLIVEITGDDSIRLMIHDGSELVLETVGAFETCPPDLLDRRNIGRELSRIGRRFSVSETKVMRVSFQITVDGRVTDAMLVQSSGSFELDAAVLEAARGWRFEPARIEGIPFPTQLVFPVTLRPPSGE